MFTRPLRVPLILLALILSLTACDSAGPGDTAPKEPHSSPIQEPPGSEPVPPPSSKPIAMSIVRGNDQVGTVGQTLPEPVVIEVRDSLDRPVEGVPIAFAVLGGEGSLSAGKDTTDKKGQAETKWTMGTSLGNYIGERRQLGEATATLSGEERRLRFQAVAQVGPPEQWSLHAPFSCGEAGTTLRYLSAKVTDAYGNTIMGQSVVASVTDGDGTLGAEALSAVETKTGPGGIASLEVTLGENEEVTKILVESQDLPSLTFEATSLFPVHIEEITSRIDAVDLSWSPSRNSEVASYKIHREDNQFAEAYEPHQTVSPVGPFTFTDTEIALGETYHYTVETVLAEEACSIRGEKRSVRAGRFLDLNADISDAAYDPLTDLLYLAIEGSSEIRVLAGESLKEESRLQLGTLPGRIALSRDGSELFVGLRERAAVQTIGLRSGDSEVLSLKTDLTGPPTYDIVEGRRGEIIASVGHVSGGGYSAQVVGLRRSDGALSNLAGSRTMWSDAQISVSPDQRFAYVADYSSSTDRLFMLDLSEPDGPIVKRNEDLDYVSATAPSADGEYLFTSGAVRPDRKASVLDASDLSIVGEIWSGLPALSPTGKWIYTANLSWLRGFEVRTFEEALAIPVRFEEITYLAASADDARAYAVTGREVFVIRTGL